MKIKIIRGTVVNKKAVMPGKVIETNDQDAKYLIALGKAVEVKAVKKRGSSKETATVKAGETAIKE